MKTSIVLFNLGGPDSLSSVKEFLFNLFYDPAIIRLPNPFRWILAKFIATKREKIAKEIYQKIGGSSPILSITQKQAAFLQEELNKRKEKEYKVFISMRYSNPFASETLKNIEEYQPDELILIPLYPQYSTTTTKSSFDEFTKLIKKSKIKDIKLKFIYNYHLNKNFIKAHVDLIKASLKKISGEYRILFSAHSLPEYIIKNGDPYQKQVEECVEEIVNNLKKNTDYIICYQSKVGNLKWLSPSTEDEIVKAAKEKSVLVVPITFVSDHSETLVELDIEYKELFKKASNNLYVRVPALNENKNFILSLVDQII